MDFFLDSSSTQHSYATRIRQNILIKPSARLRQSPLPPSPLSKKFKSLSKSHSADSNANINFLYPQFPPSGIVLHPEDANSKVFLAIGRSFLSVDNRAMTIKDLAEMTVNFGLVCQNVSAASQAITTYIRTHMHRCEVQQDHPLLLRHTLSGTSSDDDLLPALHSRSGGAHCTSNVENRATNFRRGTMVWYLSRATGAPCPFARAGIRLCDYGENGKIGQQSGLKERKRERDRQRRAEQMQFCGQKRKRPLRGCAMKGSDSESDNDIDRRPPKVKLTLRLKPLLPSTSSISPASSRRHISDSEDSDSMSVDSSEDESERDAAQNEEPWSLPPYPRRSISIPCYTPALEGLYPSYPSPSPNQADPYRRSPSASNSIGSPPPESEDETDDFHITMTRIHHSNPDADLDWDADLDSEGDGETMWESPGPRSPSAPVIAADVAVKEEPRDVQGMLEAWEDFDSSIAEAKGVADVIAQAAASVLCTDNPNKVKEEVSDPWDWEGSRGLSSPWGIPPSDESEVVKQEDFDIDSLFPTNFAGPSSPISPISSLSSQFSSFSYSDTSSPGQDATHTAEDNFSGMQKQISTLRPRSKTAPALVSLSNSISTGPSSTSMPPTLPRTYPTISSDSTAAQTLASLIQSMSMNSPASGVSPSSLVLPRNDPPQEACSEGSPQIDVVVVHTCQPCIPAISATQIEDISVYQMMLGPFLLLRRIDTDFVHLSPIVAYSGAPHPVLSTIPNGTVITKGSTTVCGTWVPLAAAQAYVRDHPLPGGILDIFLSDVLYERFPSALQDFHRSNAPGRLLNQFGLHFSSTLQAQAESSGGSSTLSWDPKLSWFHKEPSVVPLPSPVNSTFTGEKQHEESDAPLSATEQELFRELCVMPDDHGEPGTAEEIVSDHSVEKTVAENNVLHTVVACEHLVQELQAMESPKEPESPPARTDRPLRRSKRVADALAAHTQSRPRTRSRRRGSRNSLS